MAEMMMKAMKMPEMSDMPEMMKKEMMKEMMKKMNEYGSMNAMKEELSAGKRNYHLHYKKQFLLNKAKKKQYHLLNKLQSLSLKKRKRKKKI